MTEYVIVWDAGVPEGEIFRSLDDAKAAREAILANEGPQMRDFCHIATLTLVDLAEPDKHGNVKAQEGVDRCLCGCKYWENDRCVDCDEPFRSDK